MFQNISYGIGYDVHKLKERKLIIGGITIPYYNFGPLGHSDGDSVIHALIDSLLEQLVMEILEHYFQIHQNIKTLNPLYF